LTPGTLARPVYPRPDMGPRPPGEVEPLEATRLFLAVVAGEAPVTTDERALASVLDRLALTATRVTGPLDVTTELEAPEGDYAGLRARVAARFPDYGFYRAPSLDLEEEELVGDAIDDLTDIALELLDVVWFWEHSGEADALWHFHFGFETHWGSHLRALQWYVHERGAGRSELTG
jgi:hypothetical protein